MSTKEDMIAKRQLKDIVGVIMQPDLNEPHVEPKLAYKSGISKDASQYRDRNWGTLHLKGIATPRQNHNEDGDYSTSSYRPTSSGGRSAATKPHRIIGPEAFDNLRKSHGAMADIIKTLNKVDYTFERPPSRLPSTEAKDNECRSRGASIKPCLNAAENAKFVVAKPPMKLPSKEAEENYHRNQGTIFRAPSPTLPSRSAGTGGGRRGRGLWNEGICALVIAGKLSGGDPAPAIRVRGDAQEIFWHSQGSRTLLHHNPAVTSVVRQQPKDVTSKTTNYNGRSASAAPLKRRPESRRYTRKHPATVADCLKRYMG